MERNIVLGRKDKMKEGVREIISERYGQKNEYDGS